MARNKKCRLIYSPHRLTWQSSIGYEHNQTVPLYWAGWPISSCILKHQTCLQTSISLLVGIYTVKILSEVIGLSTETSWYKIIILSTAKRRINLRRLNLQYRTSPLPWLITVPTSSESWSPHFQSGPLLTRVPIGGILESNSLNVSPNLDSSSLKKPNFSGAWSSSIITGWSTNVGKQNYFHVRLKITRQWIECFFSFCKSDTVKWVIFANSTPCELLINCITHTVNVSSRYT